MNNWKKTFFFAFIAQVLATLGLNFAMPFLPFFVGELGAAGIGEQAFWAGVALSASGFTFALFAPVWGVLADRHGRKLMLCRAMLGGTVVMLLISFSQTVGQLVVLRLIQGAFSGSLTASIALVASVVPHRRSGLTLGMMQAAVFVGHTIGPLLGGITADAFGYRASFQVGAVLSLAGGLLVYFGVYENFTPATEEDRENGSGFKQIFMLKGFFVAVLVMFGVRYSNSIINPSFPLIVQEILPDAKNLNSITGSVKASAALAGAVSAGLLGHFGDKIGGRRVLIGCCIAACVAAVGHFYAYSLNELFLARILFGVAVAGMLPAANAAIHSIIDYRCIGKAYGLATSISMLGAAFGPLTGGYIARLAGLRAPFLFTAGGQIMIAVMVILFFKSKNYCRIEEKAPAK